MTPIAHAYAQIKPECKSIGTQVTLIEPFVSAKTKEPIYINPCQKQKIQPLFEQNDNQLPSYRPQVFQPPRMIVDDKNDENDDFSDTDEEFTKWLTAKKTTN